MDGCHRAVNDLAELLDATRKITAQTRQRVAGTTPSGESRQVSLHDADARPIAKGRLGKPVEFGGKAQVVDNDDGVIVDHNMEPGNPAEADVRGVLGGVMQYDWAEPRSHVVGRRFSFVDPYGFLFSRASRVQAWQG